MKITRFNQEKNLQSSNIKWISISSPWEGLDLIVSYYFNKKSPQKSPPKSLPTSTDPHDYPYPSEGYLSLSLPLTLTLTP